MGLSVLGVALGVAVVVAIDLANTSASRAFELSAETVTGKATHQVVGAAGTLDESVYRTLRVEGGIEDAAPVVEGYATLAPDTTAGSPAAEARTMQVLGIDPFAEAPFRPFVATGTQALALNDFIGAPTALLSAPTARTMGLAPGDTLRLDIEGVTRTLLLAGLIEPDDERTRRAAANLLVTDISTAQTLFEQPGRLSRVDLIVPKGSDGEQRLERIRSALPESAQVRRSESRTQTVEQMTRAFELNLTALSLLALVVGAFLIYNTMTFSVVQRRGLIGRLRAIGVTRRQIFRVVVGEAALLGLAGTVVGLLMGIAMAFGLVQLITRAINDLYFVVNVRELTIAPFTLLKGAVLGIGTTVAAALAPAREATNAPVSTVLQRSTQESGIQDLAPRLAAAGAALGVLGGALLLIPTRSIIVGYLSLLLVLVAAALITPLFVLSAARFARPILGRIAGVIGRMASRGVATTLSRTGVAIAALTIAIASTVGVGVMIDSFRGTVVTWLTQSLQADVYVQPPSQVFRRSDASLQPEVVRTLRSMDGVESTHSVRRTETQSQHGATELVAIEEGPSTSEIYRFKTGSPSEIWPSFSGGDFVLVSEPYSYKHRVGVGDTLRVQTDRGPARFPIRGVYYDYGSDIGVVMMSRETYTQYYDDSGYSGIALYVQDGVDPDALIAEMRAAVAGMQDVFIRSNRALRQTSLEIFDRTFTITTVLRLLAIVVAFIGVLSALMALELERSRELGVLRATGMTPGQVGRYVTLQTGLMGLIAGLASLPLGYALAYVLVYVINKRSFGWTLQLEVPPEVLLQAVGLAVVAAILAGIYPAYKMANTSPSEALREG
jgi:putative ABC transport system permease protein